MNTNLYPDGVPAWAKAGLPSPDDLATNAAMESEEIDPGDYMDAIVTLREKGFSWRRVAQWFKQQGFDFSHVALYRAYQEHLELQQQEEEGDDHESHD